MSGGLEVLLPQQYAVPVLQQMADPMQVPHDAAYRLACPKPFMPLPKKLIRTHTIWPKPVEKPKFRRMLSCATRQPETSESPEACRGRTG